MFCPDALLGDKELWISGEQAKYISRVMRLTTDDSVVVFDGKGGEYAAVTKEFAKDRVLLSVGKRHANEIESPLAIQMVQGLSRGGRMDFVIRKSTELGVRHITPVTTEYSVDKLDTEKAARRCELWLKVAPSAREQCGCNTLPEIDMPQRLDSWLGGLPGDSATGIMLDPGCGFTPGLTPRPASTRVFPGAERVGIR